MVKNKIIILLWIALMINSSGCFHQGQIITTASLLSEMTDREQLAYFPEQEYTLKQFSSYNQTSTKPDHFTWFANLDNNYFLRTEENNGRREFVLFDADGPGAVVRFWTTFNRYDREGVLRFYFDNDAEPRIEGDPMLLISGGKLAGYPLSFSVSEETDYSRRGHNLYLPIPYDKHLKITYETDGIKEARDGLDEGPDQEQEMFYYQINYRTYKEGTKILSFSPEQLTEHNDILNQTLDKLKTNNRGLDEGNLITNDFSGKLAPGESLSVKGDNGGAIRKFQVRINADNVAQALRSTVLSFSFDGNQTVWSPIGDFFGTGYQIKPFSTWYNEVLPDSTLQVFWIMPYKNGYELQISNLGDQVIEVLDGEILTSPWKWNSRSMHFGSSWYQNTKINTGLIKGRDGKGDFTDIKYTALNGQGVFVGDAVTLFNCSPAWWGEGDEKIFVDNEAFPSHFGTGTEDYYGYAWCRPEPFIHSFIAQPDGTGNLSVGYTLNMRYRTLDAIPFNSRLQFDMEMWHWGYTLMNHAPVTYWYLKPGGNCEITPDPAGAKEPVVLHREQLFPPVINEKGIIEGEDLVIDNIKGRSEARIRPVPVPKKPNWTRAMMFWNGISEGDEVTYKFYCETPGNYDITILTMNGRGKATISIGVNGKTILPIFRMEAMTGGEVPVQLTGIALEKGTNLLTIKALDYSGMVNKSLGIDNMIFTASNGR
ncbi:MAG: DUF2961 domain-containing protein [Bacteroidales bacterium]|nr:DUF2961 domain-containing protein [Bacteroidales bacterium]